VTSIGELAFYNNSITSLAFEETVAANWTSNSNLFTIGVNAFKNSLISGSLITITIPRNITHIYANAFQENASLKQVSLNRVTKIGSNAFSGMANKPRVLVYNTDGLTALVTWRNSISALSGTPNEQNFSALDGSDIWFIPYYHGLMSNICFPAGTPIDTDQGKVDIDKLCIEQHTIRGESIVAITKTVTEDKCLIRFDAGSLYKNVPSARTEMSCEHCIFHNRTMVRAVDLARRLPGVYKVPYSGEPLYNVLLDAPGKMLVNNLIAETLHPNNGTAKLVLHLLAMPDVRDREEFVRMYNKDAKKRGVFKKNIHRL
jgi:hypothetical protein